MVFALFETRCTTNRANKKQVVHPEYVLHGFEYDDKDPNSSVVVKALKAYLRPTLPRLAGGIKAFLQECLDEEIAHSKRDDDGT